MAKLKIDDSLWDLVSSMAEEEGVRVQRCGHGTVVTDEPLKVGMLIGYAIRWRETTSQRDSTPALNEALDMDVVVRTRAQDLRRECLRRLASMHNIVALRAVKLDTLSAEELRSLAIVLQGIESNLAHARRKAREPWRR